MSGGMFNPGSEQTVQLPGGKAVRLGKLRLKVLRAWRDWVAEQVGDPFADAERLMGRAPDATVNAAIRRGEDLRDQLRFFSLGCPLAQQAVNTEEGAARLVHLLMLEKDPRASEEDAFEVVIHLSARVAEVLKKAQGDASGGEGGEGGEGNAPAGAAGPACGGATSTGV